MLPLDFVVVVGRLDSARLRRRDERTCADSFRLDVSRLAAQSGGQVNRPKKQRQDNGLARKLKSLARAFIVCQLTQWSLFRRSVVVAVLYPLVVRPAAFFGLLAAGCWRMFSALGRNLIDRMRPGARAAAN